MKLSNLFLVSVLSMAMANGIAVAKGDDAFAVVNGTAISAELFNQNLNANLKQGQVDTPELRKAIKEELINREVIIQDVQKKGLDRTPTALDDLEKIKKNYLFELGLADYIKNNPISDDDLKLEYARQISLLSSQGVSKEYKVSQILTSNKDDALKALSRIEGGESFEQVAKEMSSAPSKVNGGSLGWLLPNQIFPAVSGVIVKLGKNSVASAPIETQFGWNVIKVDDIRDYEPPSFDKSKEPLGIALFQQRKEAYIKKLRGAAKVKYQ